MIKKTLCYLSIHLNWEYYTNGCYVLLCVHKPCHIVALLFVVKNFLHVASFVNVLYLCLYSARILNIDDKAYGQHWDGSWQTKIAGQPAKYYLQYPNKDDGLYFVRLDAPKLVFQPFPEIQIWEVSEEELKLMCIEAIINRESEIKYANKYLGPNSDVFSGQHAWDMLLHGVGWGAPSKT